MGAHLHNTLDTSMRLSYWRDDPDEADFVISQGPRVLGIEVKSGPRARSLRGLGGFRKRFPGAGTLVVAGGDAVEWRGALRGTRVVPVNEFLSQPASWWLEDSS